MSTLKEKLLDSQIKCRSQSKKITALEAAAATTGKKLRKVDSKLRIIRALYMLVYNDERSAIPLALEMFHMLGEVLEGIDPKDLDLHLIDKDVLLKEIASSN